MFGIRNERASYEEAALLPRAIISLARRPPWSHAAGNASHLRCLRLRRPTTRVSSIISRTEERNSRIWTRTSMELSGGGVFNSFVVVGCRAFLHPSFHRIFPSFLPSAPLIPDISLSLPLTLKAVIDRQMMPPQSALCSVDFAPKVIESCAANIHPRR